MPFGGSQNDRMQVVQKEHGAVKEPFSALERDGNVSPLIGRAAQATATRPSSSDIAPATTTGMSTLLRAH
jgi:hypothetical protein